MKGKVPVSAGTAIIAVFGFCVFLFALNAVTYRPSTTRETVAEKVLMNNIRALAVASELMLRENPDLLRVTYKDLVGPGKLLADLPPIDGEYYRGFSRKRDDRFFTIITSSGVHYRYLYEERRLVKLTGRAGHE